MRWSAVRTGSAQRICTRPWPRSGPNRKPSDLIPASSRVRARSQRNTQTSVSGDGAPSPETDVWVFLCDLARTLEEAGIKSEGFRFGPDRGQGRVQMRWADPVRTADHLMLYRWFARSLA